MLNRAEMILRLNNIKKPIVSDIGSFDTGVEFRILTREKGYFCMGGTEKPIHGPLRLKAQEYELVKRAAEQGFSFAGSEASSLADLFKSHGVQLDGIEKRVAGRIDANKYTFYREMDESSFTHGKKYFVFQLEDGYDDKQYFYSYEDAQDALVDAIVNAQKGESWDKMDDEELEEWVEFIPDESEV